MTWTRSSRLVLVLMVLTIMLFLPSCATAPHATELAPPQIVKVPVPASCPAKAEYDKLSGSRPTPLRSQPMPGTPEERSAKMAAQLGRYEAEGGWADRAQAALDRCQLTDAP